MVTRPTSSHADVGLASTRGSSPIDRRYGDIFVNCGDDEMTKLEENLNRLTLDIPNILVHDLPKRCQRHNTGVLGHFNHFLCRVVRDIMCYHENH